jgi:hypothetical protein
MPQVSMTAADIENFHRCAEVCRAEAAMSSEPARRQERLDTALAYERMAERAKRYLSNESLFRAWAFSLAGHPYDEGQTRGGSRALGDGGVHLRAGRGRWLVDLISAAT